MPNRDLEHLRPRSAAVTRAGASEESLLLVSGAVLLGSAALIWFVRTFFLLEGIGVAFAQAFATTAGREIATASPLQRVLGTAVGPALSCVFWILVVTTLLFAGALAVHSRWAWPAAGAWVGAGPLAALTVLLAQWPHYWLGAWAVTAIAWTGLVAFVLRALADADLPTALARRAAA